MTADYEVTKKLHSTMDAQVWAQEWCRIAREIVASNDERELIDEGWMIGWFANAIMMGWDEHARRYPPGICPNCGEPIIDHDSQERKRCHDAVSGYRRESPPADYEPLPRRGDPRLCSLYGHSEPGRCPNCGAHNEQIRDA